MKSRDIYWAIGGSIYSGSVFGYLWERDHKKYLYDKSPYEKPILVGINTLAGGIAGAKPTFGLYYIGFCGIFFFNNYVSRKLNE